MLYRSNVKHCVRSYFSNPTPPLGAFGAETTVKMFKPKPKMLQEISPSLLFPLFERGLLEPTIPATRRL
ncbi:hypothetical protein L596_009784 [Steinernema carpocapsae]|uniref:Uncharacterized protein n=1 Tax=Steinernema carpocapsae TaxID=34508 RepID=A0A4U5PHP0_STECR|nr:hypothetical protein L596_009784 [Steinernema carpocapsae]